MPDKIYDYTAAGLPVVNSLGGEVSDLIREEQIGLQYKAGDPRDLLAALEKLTSDRLLRDEMARNSFEIGMRYDRHAQYVKLVEIVDNVCSGRKASAAAAG